MDRGYLYFFSNDLTYSENLRLWNGEAHKLFLFLKVYSLSLMIFVVRTSIDGVHLRASNMISFHPKVMCGSDFSNDISDDLVGHLGL